MSEFEITSLYIGEPDQQPIPNRFFQQKNRTTTLGVLFPGLQYTNDMPLLFYTGKVLRMHGADVLQVNTDYTVPEFQALTPAERAQRLFTDAQAALQAGRVQREYTRLVLAGKSIGTLVLAQLISSGQYSTALTIWLTPLLRQPQLVTAASQLKSPALFLAGTGDSTFDARVLEEIRAETGAEAIIIPSANHSLEIEADLPGSLAALQEVILGIDAFLHRQGI
jgi:dienelactone hydrolase